MGLILVPLVSIEAQVEAKMTQLGIKFLSLTRTPAAELVGRIRAEKPQMLVTNVETLASCAVQRAVSRFPLAYIAIDECQVSQD
jgi:hypothetical protein